MASLPSQGPDRPHKKRWIMMHTIKKFSDPMLARWDQHCLLVIQFPFSLHPEIQHSARFAEVKRGLRQSLDRFTPGRSRDFFTHPSTFSFPIIKNALA